ncbi:hypothetical protein CEXT_187611 [Caerostris extrusa]|uniref:Uncharacterized protein n=1 Tax=Caerostris extrusa TaxID=172846 RepID=A0AAV4WWY5_CAEEX|nr:hypothetical protein CEXT_187611 [Caerostris extrusa]
MDSVECEENSVTSLSQQPAFLTPRMYSVLHLLLLVGALVCNSGGPRKTVSEKSKGEEKVLSFPRQKNKSSVEHEPDHISERSVIPLRDTETASLANIKEP